MKELIFKCDECKEKINGKAIGATRVDREGMHIGTCQVISKDNFDKWDELFCSVKCFSIMVQKVFKM